jgi:hypothetical protein
VSVTIGIANEHHWTLLQCTLLEYVANHCSQLVYSVASNVALLPTHLQVRSEHPRLSQRLSPAAVHRSNGRDPYFAGYLLLSSHIAPTAASYYTFGSLFTTQTGPLYRSVGSNHIQWSATLRLRHDGKVKGGRNAWDFTYPCARNS